MEELLILLTSMTAAAQKIFHNWFGWQTREAEIESQREERKYFYETLYFAVKGVICLFVLMILAFFSVTIYLVFEVSKKQDIHYYSSSTRGDKKGKAIFILIVKKMKVYSYVFLCHYYLDIGQIITNFLNTIAQFFPLDYFMYSILLGIVCMTIYYISRWKFTSKLATAGTRSKDINHKPYQVNSISTKKTTRFKDTTRTGDCNLNNNHDLFKKTYRRCEACLTEKLSKEMTNQPKNATKNRKSPKQEGNRSNMSIILILILSVMPSFLMYQYGIPLLTINNSYSNQVKKESTVKQNRPDDKSAGTGSSMMANIILNLSTNTSLLFCSACSLTLAWYYLGKNQHYLIKLALSLIVAILSSTLLISLLISLALVMAPFLFLAFLHFKN